LTSAAFAVSDTFENVAKLDFKTVQLKSAQLKGIDALDLGQLRGIVFGRHGRIFKEDFIDIYLRKQSWYKPRKDFSNSELNQTERDNLDIIREAEAKQHTGVQIGDLRFWRDRLIKKSDLAGDDESGTSNTDLNIMAAEIEAIHGKRFTDSPMLQAYFDDRYWYKPAAKYDPTTLNKFERANLKFIQSELALFRKESLIGDLDLLDNHPIPPKMLQGMNLHELRLARNWIYALRGYPFHTQWLAEYFEMFEWYKPLPSAAQAKLTKVDQDNIGLILKVEQAKHEALSQRVLTKADLRGMFVEDLRKLANEIPARHGKVFKDKWLASYFSSMPWYKPNKAYSDKLLTSVERKNQAFLMKAKDAGFKQFDIAEG